MDLDGVSQWLSLQTGLGSARKNFIYNLDTLLNETVKPFNGFAAYRYIILLISFYCDLILGDAGCRMRDGDRGW